MKNGIFIKIEVGNIVDKTCDAYIVPQYPTHPNQQGVSQAIAISGGMDGIEAFAKCCPVEENAVIHTPCSGSKAKHLLHITLLGGDLRKRFTAIQKTVYLALNMAEKLGIAKICCPVLGMEGIDSFLASNSAKAILSAIDIFPNRKGVVKEFTIVHYFQPYAAIMTRQVLDNELYRDARSPDEKDFDFRQWAYDNVISKCSE